MPDTGAPWNIPYVESTDLVSGWPADSLALANAIDAGLDAAGSPGIGSNVVQTTKNNAFSTTSSTFVPVTGLTATITPSSATSKILVIVDIFLSTDNSSGSGGGAFARLTGGNAANYIGAADGARTRTTSAYWYSENLEGRLRGQSATIVYLDSPATASPVAYGVDVARSVGGTVFVNRVGADASSALRPAAASSITVIEVAA